MEAANPSTLIQRIDWARLARLECEEPREPRPVVSQDVDRSVCAASYDGIDVWEHNIDGPQELYLPPLRKFRIVVNFRSSGTAVLGFSGVAKVLEGPGGRFIVPPFRASYVRTFEPVSNLIIYFPHEFVGGLPPENADHAELRADIGKQDPMVEAIALALHQQVVRGITNASVRQHLVKAMALHVLGSCGARQPLSKSALTGSQLKAVRDLLMARLHERPRTAEVASVIGLAPARFSKMFKSATDHSLSTFAHRLRMQRARELIETTRSSVTEVALDLGYYDNAHLTRHFTRFWGIPPSALRTRR